MPLKPIYMTILYSRKMDDKGPEKGRSRMSAAIGLGSEFAGGIALFTFIGYKLDQHYQTGEIWTLAGIFLGLVCGFYQVWKIVRISEKNSEDDE